MKKKHTPTPWNTAGRWAVQTRFGLHFDLYKSEYTVEQLDEVEANAAFIVRACNAHDELVAANDSLSERLGIAYEGMATALKFLEALKSSTGSLAAGAAAENLSKALSKARGEA